MATANNFLQVADTNVLTIKENFKTFLKSQNQFNDYDWDSSALSILLDVLAYNSYYNNTYNNMAVNEMFLKSAILRENAVARAQELGYTPRSSKSAKAEITIKVNPLDTPNEIVVPAYTQFTSVINNVTYTFTTQNDYILTNDGSGNYIGYLDIYEGIVLNYTFVYDSNKRKYTISNSNLDTDSIVLSVRQNNLTTDKVVFSRYNGENIDSDSAVYFIEENIDGNYDITFGDGVFGKKLTNGNIIEINARFCNGEEGNDIDSFTSTGYVAYNKSSPTTNYSVTSITTTNASEGGQEKEDIESVKYLAPKFFSMQNRLVTEDDIKSYVLKHYSDIEAISVWGGEKNDPPYFGKVLMSLKPKNGFAMSLVRKQEIINEILPKCVTAIDPLIIDPSFTFMNVTIKIDYDSKVTSLTYSELYDKISDAVTSYEKTDLSVFNSGFYLSKFTTMIDQCDTSIKNTKTELVIEKRITPIMNSSISYKLSFNSPIFHPYDGYL